MNMNKISSDRRIQKREKTSTRQSTLGRSRSYLLLIKNKINIKPLDREIGSLEDLPWIEH